MKYNLCTLEKAAVVYIQFHSQAGHDALSPCGPVNTAIGVLVHTFVLTPYYSWRVTHSTHHVRRVYFVKKKFA